MSAHSHTARRAAGALVGCLVLLCTVTSLALAQKKEKKKECEPDDGESTELYSGRLFLQKVTDPKVDSMEKQDDLKGAINALAPRNHVHNDIGQAYLLGDALTIWVARRPDVTAGPRSYFGFKENPNANVDILHMADSLLTYLETKRPECADMVHGMRQQAFVPIVNVAIRQLNDSKIDSAVANANRSLEIYKGSPFSYNVLAGAAIKNNDYASAVTNYEKAIQLADTTSMFASLKRGALFNVAVITQQQAAADSGADRKAKLAASVDRWKSYTAAYPDDQNGKDGLSNALQVAGDTLSAAQVTNQILTDPSGHSAMDLFRAGLTAAHNNDQASAVRMFEAGLQKNPYFRDAVYYVSTIYYNQGDTTKLFPMARRLIDLDPSNPESYHLLAGAYQMRGKADKKNPTKLKIDNDSTLLYNNKYKNMMVKLTVTNFDRQPNKLTISGRVDNLGDKDKTYPLNFKFMDSTGTVIATQSAPALTVPAKSSKDFSITVEKGGIAAYKYDPLE